MADNTVPVSGLTQHGCWDNGICSSAAISGFSHPLALLQFCIFTYHYWTVDSSFSFSSWISFLQCSSRLSVSCWCFKVFISDTELILYHLPSETCSVSCVPFCSSSWRPLSHASHSALGALASASSQGGFRGREAQTPVFGFHSSVLQSGPSLPCMLFPSRQGCHLPASLIPYPPSSLLYIHLSLTRFHLPKVGSQQVFLRELNK